MRLAAVLIAIAVAAAACSGATSDTADPIDRLVIVADSGNVATLAPDGSDVVLVTDDAGPAVAYFQPNWSPDGTRLAFAEVRDGTTSVVVTGVDGDGAVRTPTENLAFYVYWAPNGAELAWLRNGATGSLVLEVADGVGGEPSQVAAGAPLYFDWAPTSDHLIAHVGADRLDVLTIGADPEPLDVDPGLFQAPQWTKRGIFYGARSATGQRIERWSDGTVTAIARISGTATFAADSRGRRIAIQGFVPGDGGAQSAAFQEAPLLPVNHLTVIDLDTGERDTVLAHPTVGFVWSPGGESLAILETGSGPGTLRWRVWEDGEEIELASFVPSASMLRDIYPFFDQYARSMRFWSPDGTRLVAAGSIGEESGIWVFDTSGGDPVLVADGDYAAWSPG